MKFEPLIEIGSSNTFTVELSDQYGYYYENTVELASMEGNTSGSITIAVPEEIPYGSNYRVGVNSTSPANTGLINENALTIYPQPEPQIQSNDSICQGASLKFTTDTELWLDNIWQSEEANLIDSGANFIEYSWATPGSKTISLTQTNPETGCTGSTFTVIDVLPVPEVSLVMDTTYCENDEPVELTGGSPESGTYSVNGVIDSIFTPGQAEIGITSIKYEYINEKGCKNSAEIDLHVYENPPKPEISQEGDSLLSSADGGNQWYKNDELIEGANKKHYIPTDTGSYTVQVTSAHGCESEMSEPYDITTGVNDLITSEFQLKIYPNPYGSHTKI